MVYCQFLILSTGYIPGTIPPQFSKEHIKPIDMCGSDSVFRMDARKSLDSMIYDCEKRMARMLNKPIGFRIIRATNFLDKGQEVYKKVYLD